MERVKKIINDTEYEFFNEFQDCRDGFNHRTILFKNGHKLNESKVHYINRTWESYAYQSVMKKSVNIEIEYLINRIKEKFKTEKGYQKITKNRKDEFDNYLNSYTNYIELKELYNTL